MGVNLGSAYGKIDIDVSGVETSMARAKGSLTGFQTAAEKVGRGMIVAGAGLTAGVTTPLVALGVAGVKAASDLEESQNKVTVVFGESADAITAWSETSADAFGQSQQQALEATGTFGNLFDSMGIGIDQTSDMSMGLVELAGDLASFNNIDPGIALEKLRAGIVGEAEPLRTLGVNLTEVGVNARAMEMGLAATAKELTVADKVTARYALIMEQTANAQGDFARTSEGLANSTRILQAEWKNTSAALAKELLPVALDLVGILRDLIEWFQKLPEPVKKGIIVVGAIAAVLGPVIMAIGSVISVISALAGAVSGIGAAVGAAAAAIGTALAPILIIVAAVAAVAALLYLAWKTNFLGLRDIVDAVWGAIKATFEQIKAIVGSVMAFLRGEITFDELAAQVGASMSKIGEVWRAAWERLGQIVAEIWPRILELVTKAIGAVGNAIINKIAEWIAPLVGGMDRAKQIVTGAFQNIADFLGNVWEGIKGGAKMAWDAISTIIGAAVEGIRTIVAVVMQALAGDWRGALDTIASGVAEKFEAIRAGIAEVVTVIGGLIVAGWENMIGVVSGIMERLKGVIMGAWDAVKSAYYALKGEDPSQVVTPEQAAAQVAIWQEMVNQFTLSWQMMQTTVTTIANAIKTLLDVWLAAVKLAMVTTWTEIQTQSISIWNSIRDGVISAAQAMASRVIGIVQNMRNQVNGILNGLAGDARRAGEAIGRALAQGLESQIGRVAAAARALAAAVRSNLPGSDAEEGPLSDLTAAGMALPETLAQGIAAGQSALVRAAQAMAAATSGAIAGAWTPAMATAQAGAYRGDNTGYAPVTVSINVERIGDEVDVENLAYRISEVLNWRRR